MRELEWWEYPIPTDAQLAEMDEAEQEWNRQEIANLADELRRLRGDDWDTRERARDIRGNPFR